MKRLALILLISATVGQRVDGVNYVEIVDGSNLQINMVYLSGGEYVMGSPTKERGRKKDEGPKHTVSLSPFWISSYEITWDLYELFLNKIDQKRVENRGPINLDIDGISGATVPYVNYNQPGHPVINITQYGASQFCKWLTAKTGDYYRLPTEAEWEYACRSSTETTYSFGNSGRKINQFGWYKKNSGGKLQKIGLKSPNGFGLYDMHGNAAEWVLDSYDPGAYIKRKMVVYNPIIRMKSLYPRVVRGGSYKDSLSKIRSSSRGFSSQRWKQRDPQIPKSLWWHTNAKHVGFRIVRTIDVPSRDKLYKYWVKPIKEY